MAWPNLIRLSLVVILMAYVMPVVDQVRCGHHDIYLLCALMSCCSRHAWSTPGCCRQNVRTPDTFALLQSKLW
jgi:hypothetical protein